MAQEIERKFLVSGDFKSEAAKATRITQGYLSSVPERTVRVRIKGDNGYMTVKGIGSDSGASPGPAASSGRRKSRSKTCASF